MGNPEVEAAYQVPAWFTERNVKTNMQLLEAPSKVEIIEENPREDISETVKREVDPKTGSSPKIPPKCKNLIVKNENAKARIHQYEFSKLRDISTAALVRDTQGNLNPLHASVFLEVKSSREVQAMDSVVEVLARNIGADLIAFDLEDLEDLGIEFDRQDRERQATVSMPNLKQDTNDGETQKHDDSKTDQPQASTTENREFVNCSPENTNGTPSTPAKGYIIDEKDVDGKEVPDCKDPFGLAKFYFGTPNASGRYGSTSSHTRTKNALSAIIDPLFAKLCLKSIEDMDLQSHNNPLLICLRGLDLIEDITEGYRFPARLLELVREHRVAGRAALVIAVRAESAPNASTTSISPRYSFIPKMPAGLGIGCSCLDCTRGLPKANVNRVRRKFLNNGPAVLPLELEINIAGVDYHDDEHRTLRLNERSLKRSLRKLFRPRSCRLLALDTDWHTIPTLANSALLKHSTISKDEIESISRRIFGRTWKDSELHVDCVAEVITEIDKGLQRKKAKEASSSDASPDISSMTSTEKKLYESQVLKPGSTDIGFSDVIMDESTKNSIKHLVSMASFPTAGRSSRLLEQLRISGMLFYGPPGTGKSHLCRAIANDSKQRMISISAADIESKWVGESEQNIQAVFSLARKISPSIIFIDEADALFYRRSPSDRSWERKLLNQILQEMDGIKSEKVSVLVIASTNRPMDLDEAFLRRLPHKVRFSLPSRLQRREILKLFLLDEELDPKVSLDALADATNDFSGSDLRSLCSQAALAWSTEHMAHDGIMSEESEIAAKLVLTMQHFAIALSHTSSTAPLTLTKELDSWAAKFNNGSNSLGKLGPASAEPTTQSGSKQVSNWLAKFGETPAGKPEIESFIDRRMLKQRHET